MLIGRHVATAALTFLLLLETALAVAGVAVGGAAATGLATVFFLGFSFLAFFFGATAGAGVGVGAGAGGASAGGGAPVVWAHGHLSPLRHPAAEAKNAHGLDLSENRVYLLKGARGAESVAVLRGLRSIVEW